MYVDDQSALVDLCERARAAGRVGLDAEFIRERTYYPVLALVQLAVDDELSLIDPLSNIDLEPLDALVQDAAVIKVLHAATQDLEIFYHRSGELPKGVFDTQVAAALLGYGNQISYGGLVDRVLRVTLAKGESFTDWLKRPLTEKQERYALDDVRYLLPLHDALAGKLDEHGRTAWCDEELERYQDRHLYVPDIERLHRRVKRANSLDGRGLAVLQSLAEWREEEAVRRDRPRRSIIADEVLVEMARRRPQKPGELKRYRGLHPREAARSGDALVAAARRGMERPPIEPPNRKRKRLPAGGEVTVEILQACMRAICHEHDLAPAIVANNAALESFAIDYFAGKVDAERHSVLQGWRRELVGDRLVAILEGKVKVFIDPETGMPGFEDA